MMEGEIGSKEENEIPSAGGDREVSFGELVSRIYIRFLCFILNHSV